jgi:DNA-binding CsgD family transcriptional regulator
VAGCFMLNFSNIESALKLITVHLYSKDIEGKFLNCNEQQAWSMGLKNEKAVIGKTDFDIWDPRKPNSEGTCVARILRENDKQVITSKKTINFIESVSSDNSYFSIKQPLYDQYENINGISGISIEITSSNFIETIINTAKAFGLSESDLKLSSSYQEYLKIKSRDFKLSIREIECLYHLVRGKTAKMIAQFLNLSPRTVESYIENIKAKFGCYTKSELLDKALQKGF